MGSGSMCPKHERWNPDGVCPYCVPATPERVLVTAKSPETRRTPTAAGFMREAALDLLVAGRAAVVVDEDGEARKATPAELADALGDPRHDSRTCGICRSFLEANPLLVDLPYGESPGARALRDTAEIEKWERAAKARARFSKLEDKDDFAPWPRLPRARLLSEVKFLGVTIKTDPSLKDDEFRFEPVLERVQCYCGRNQVTKFATATVGDSFHHENF